MIQANDIALSAGGGPVDSIARFNAALREIVGRPGIRNDVSRCEAVGFGLAEMDGCDPGWLFPAFPIEDSPLRLRRFFDTLYVRYDTRFLTRAPGLATVTRCLEWAPGSPAALARLDDPARVAVSTASRSRPAAGGPRTPSERNCAHRTCSGRRRVP